MASPFKGYLLKAVKTGAIFPDEYIEFGSWDSTPNQREEIKAYRDDNTRDLTRITSQGRKSTWKFKTRENLHLADKMAIQKFFTDAESDADQRKIRLQFWNDETNDYQEGDFYRPNMPFKHKSHTDDDIIYQSLELEGVEY